MRLYREGTPGQRAGGQGSPGGLLSTWHTVLRFMVMGLVSGLSLVSPLAWPIVGLDSSVKDSGRLAGHMKGWCLLPSRPLPNSPSCWWQHRVPYLGLLSCDSLASGHHWAWPGQGVSVNSALTESGKIPVISTVLQPRFTFTSSHKNSNKNKTVLLLLMVFFNISFEITEIRKDRQAQQRGSECGIYFCL